MKVHDCVNELRILELGKRIKRRICKQAAEAWMTEPAPMQLVLHSM